MHAGEPVVSVVIPTRERVDLVRRAVASALAQTLQGVEVIVVVDGPDPNTVEALRVLADPRVRVHPLPARVGASAARNAGVAAARGRWVAFLDDDDQWFAPKLEAQFRAAQRSRYRYPIIACRFIARGEGGDLVWPRRTPEPGEALSDYLFCQRGLFGGEGLIPPSALLTAHDLLSKVPFRPGLIRHNDCDWLLRTATLEGAGVEFVPDAEPLAVWNLDENRSRLSNSADWRYALSWIRANRDLVTSRAYAAFVLITPSRHAARGKAWRAFGVILWEAFRHGTPTWTGVAAFLLIWLVPRAWRTRVSAALARRRSRDGPASRQGSKVA